MLKSKHKKYFILFLCLVSLLLIFFNSCSNSKEKEISETNIKQEYMQKIKEYLTENELNKYIISTENDKEFESIWLSFSENNIFIIKLENDNQNVLINISVYNDYDNISDKYRNIDFEVVTDIVNIVSRKKFDCADIQSRINNSKNLSQYSDKHYCYDYSYDFFDKFSLLYTFDINNKNYENSAYSECFEISGIS